MTGRCMVTGRDVVLVEGRGWCDPVTLEPHGPYSMRSASGVRNHRRSTR